MSIKIRIPKDKPAEIVSVDEEKAVEKDEKKESISKGSKKKGAE